MLANITIGTLSLVYKKAKNTDMNLDQLEKAKNW